MLQILIVSMQVEREANDKVDYLRVEPKENYVILPLTMDGK